MRKGTPSPGLGSLGSGALTAAALAVQTGLAAFVGVIIARDFGRTAQTDGFFASYGVFAVLVLAATAARVTALPALARARDARRLGAEFASYALAAGLVVVPLLVVGVAAAHPAAALLTGFGPARAREAAASTLPWMILAATLQLFAGLAASALAALDDYAVAATSFGIGSVAGLVFILLRVHHDGIDAVSWGMALNAALAVSIPVAVLALRARRERMPRGAVRPPALAPKRHLLDLAAGVSFPLALQAIYLVCLPLAAHEGVGSVTSFSYAYLIGSAVVAVTASSLGLVTSVPLTRAGIGPEGIARHVVATSWLALLAVAAVAGIFAVAGQQLTARFLGSGYERHVGSGIASLVVALTPWMIASVGVAVVFPLFFVVERGAHLPSVAAAAVLVHVALAFALRALFGLTGLAVALAVTTALCLLIMLAVLRAVRLTLTGLARAVLLAGALAAAAFGIAGLVLGAFPAAGAGLLLYVVFLATARPPGLRGSWRYLRTLG